MSELTRKQVKELVADVNKHIARNNKKYSIVRTSGQIVDEAHLKKAQRPKDGHIVLPYKVADKMSRPQGSKFIRGGRRS